MDLFCSVENSHAHIQFMEGNMKKAFFLAFSMLSLMGCATAKFSVYQPEGLGTPQASRIAILPLQQMRNLSFADLVLGEKALNKAIKAHFQKPGITIIASETIRKDLGIKPNDASLPKISQIIDMYHPDCIIACGFNNYIETIQVSGSTGLPSVECSFTMDVYNKTQDLILEVTTAIYLSVFNFTGAPPSFESVNEYASEKTIEKLAELEKKSP
jgi:hypothetical protein